MLEESLGRHGRSAGDIQHRSGRDQFTASDAFTGLLKANGIQISMDGKGSWKDNVFVERLWTERQVPHRDLNGLGRRWEATLAALDAGMDARDADDTVVDNGAVRVRKGPCYVTQKAHSTSDGEVERRSEGQAKGTVDSRGRPGTAYTSCHCQEVHRSRESAHKALRG